MNIREINKPITAKSLNESLAKKFGQKINIDAFTLEQLQDARNRIRTKLSQVETNESFDSVHTNENYQKSKLFLDVLNAAISEREDIAEKKGAKPDYLDFDGDGNKKEPMKKALKDKKKKKVGESQIDELGVTDRQTGQTSTLPSQRITNPGDEQAVIVQRYLKAKAENDRATMMMLQMLIRDMYGDETLRQVDAQRRSANQADQRNRGRGAPSPNVPQPGPAAPTAQAPATRTPGESMEESVVTEGAEDQAELVMAAKDMVDRLTGWMEDTAEMQSESMLELADAIRDEMGQEQSEAFTNAVKPALEQLYAAMETTRTALTQGVGQLTGEAPPVADMPGDDMGDMGDMEPPVGDEAMPEPVEGAEDDFGAAEPAAGGEDEAGRAKRESIKRQKKSIVENSRKLAALFSKKK